MKLKDGVRWYISRVIGLGGRRCLKLWELGGFCLVEGGSGES